VRFGSKADIGACPRDVRFTPEGGHWNYSSRKRSIAWTAALRLGVWRLVNAHAVDDIHDQEHPPLTGR
jgi:hypothetical protein